MENDLLNSLAMPIPISMDASVCVLYSGRRECVLVWQIHEQVDVLSEVQS